MKRTLMAVLVSSSTFLLPIAGQDSRIQARLTGGGGDGKCTFEVEVDGTAEVQIRGGEGYLRTLSGSPARWRRLECNQPLPMSPNEFRFSGVDGRGSQQLVRDPGSNRGIAVVRIDDRDNGREGYTGDIKWKGGSTYSNDPYSRGRNRGAWDTDGSWPSNSSRWPSNSNSGWGDSSGWGTSSSPWNNSWGNVIRYNGPGDGRFNSSGGPEYDLRNANITINRSNGSVVAYFDTNQGRSALSLTGRVTRVDNDRIEADLTSAKTRGSSVRPSGQMRIQLNADGTVRSVRADGSVDNRDFRMNWRS